MRVCFTNLGCKLNQAEIEDLGRRFTAAGHRVVASLAEADLHVINSCTVTATAASTSRQAARRAGAGVRTVLTGCYATAEPAEASRLGVDLIVANADKGELLERVHRAFPEMVSGSARPAEADAAGPTRALVKIEDGCNMRCSFCIIPATRGRQRSREQGAVIAEVRGLVAAGYREVVLTGVQISAYRDAAGFGLPELVRAILRETAVPRLRLTSIAPWDFDDRWLELWQEPRLCRHLHLSLQSGCTATLRRMRRPYSAARYAALVEGLRAALPEVAITTDVIAGFPGETAAEFAESRDFVAAMGFARVHVFPFSARPGTAAAAMPDPVPPRVRRERTAELSALAGRSEAEFRRRHLGERLEVLWERPRAGVSQGLTGNYLRVFLRGEPRPRNTFSRVRAVELAAGGLWGEAS